MCNENERNLSLDGDTFSILKEQFDRLLNRTVGNMEMKGADDAVITLKLSVSLEKGSVTVPGGIQEVTKPIFKHDISSVMQVKDKVSGQTTDDYALVWDSNEGRYVLHKIDNGQMSFDDFDENGNPVYEAEHEEVDMDIPSLPEAHDNENIFSDLDESAGDDITTPYGWMQQFVGSEMYVTEAMGNFTVRTEDNKVVLSSATNPDSVFYCEKEDLSGHVGHTLICAKDFDNDDASLEYIKIVCADCGEEVFRMYRNTAAHEEAEEEDDGYRYDVPEEN